MPVKMANYYGMQAGRVDQIDLRLGDTKCVGEELAIRNDEGTYVPGLQEQVHNPDDHQNPTVYYDWMTRGRLNFPWEEF